MSEKTFVALDSIAVGRPQLVAEPPAGTGDCQRCGGSGWIIRDYDGAVRCECLKRAIRAERISRLDGEIPPRYRHCSRENWTGPWPFEKLASWVPTKGQDPWSIVIWGPPGTGKTHAATALYRELMARFDHLLGVWLAVEEAIDRVKSEFGGKAVTKETLVACDLLLLDDVGRSTATPFTLELIRSVLYQRHLHQLPTIVTSNAMNFRDFDRIDGALSDRLKEGGVQVDFSHKQNRRLAR